MNMGCEENFSIIVPTFREADNIPELIDRISRVNIGSRLFELILVDDNSQDGIDKVVENLQTRNPWVRLVIRQGKRSLSESVIDGLKCAQYPYLVVMDADLSHPPEKVPEMLSELAKPHVDMVIGSRYVPGGSTDEIWPLSRKITSKFAAMMARLLLASDVKDPLSGFLAIRKERCFSGGKLQPIGWKISLEIMIKSNCKVIKEVPIHFAQRHHGVSKLNVKVVINYLQHIKRLAFYRLFSRLS